MADVLAVALAVAPLPASPGPIGRFSHAALDSVLARFVHAGRLDYGGVRSDPATLDRYLAAVAAARPDDWSLAGSW